MKNMRIEEVNTGKLWRPGRDFTIQGKDLAFMRRILRPAPTPKGPTATTRSFTIIFSHIYFSGDLYFRSGFDISLLPFRRDNLSSGGRFGTKLGGLFGFR